MVREERATSIPDSPTGKPRRWLIVGLGNPGAEHAKNRHNVGRRCLRFLAREHGLKLQERVHGATVAQGRIGTAEVILAQPRRSYMNECGPVVRELLSWAKLPHSQLLVISDDLDLPWGELRLRPGGGAGGHRGVLSIIHSLGTDGFPRLRIGIGRPPPGADPVDYVLANFTPQEEKELPEVLERGAAALECVLEKGIAAAMNRVN